jgi:predicted nucleic acid-binding protein
MITLTGFSPEKVRLARTSILSSDFERTVRRLKPQKHRQKLQPRNERELSFLVISSGRPRTLLYDTTVYIDILQGRFPDSQETMLRATDAWHSTVAESELASACALLDPGHRNTRNVIKQIMATINRMPPHRMICPDREIWRDAGILAGTIARLQGIPKSDRRRILNDALIFGSARKHGHTVLTRNVVDFDFLQQLDPSGKVVFYRVR